MSRNINTYLRAIILILAGCVLSAFDQTGTSYPSDPNIPQAEAQDSQVFFPLMTSQAGEIGSDDCFQIYSDTSIWNLPLDWSIAQIHPASSAMIDTFFHDSTRVGANVDMYTANLYLVDNDTPLVPVTLREYRFKDAINDITIDYGEPGGTEWMPIPASAQPAVGTDGQLAVINMDTGEEWGLIYGEPLADGSWLAGGAYRYHIENSGIPPTGFGQRGAGIGQVAGLVRPCEIERGFIGHAVTIGYDFPCAPGACESNSWPAVIPPFTKTDGSGWSEFDIPEGARLVIRPEIELGEIETACAGVRGCILWILNMQSYGGFIVDQCGHPKTYAEGNPTANWDPDVWFAEMLENIPIDWYAVVDWEYPATVIP